MAYTEFRHQHNFSVWAGARAAQRGFTNVELLRDALEQCGVTEFSKNLNLITCVVDFDRKHREWCNSICDYLNEKGVQNVTYGRAAKLIAVYLKSIIVLPNIHTPQAGFIHPPIDRILLQNLSQLSAVSQEDSKLLKNTNWTELDESNYYNVLRIICSITVAEPNWKIEEFWTITNN